MRYTTKNGSEVRSDEFLKDVFLCTKAEGIVKQGGLKDLKTYGEDGKALSLEC